MAPQHLACLGKLTLRPGTRRGARGGRVAARPGSCTYCLAVWVNITQKDTWGDLCCPEQILDQWPQGPWGLPGLYSQYENGLFVPPSQRWIWQVLSAGSTACSSKTRVWASGQSQPILPAAEAKVRDGPCLEWPHSPVHMKEAALAGGGSAWPSPARTQLGSGTPTPCTVLCALCWGLNCVPLKFVCWRPNP